MTTLGLVLTGVSLGAVERTERFDRDPGWHGHNNRVAGEGRMVKQDFGFSATSHFGGGKGEIGGFITPCGEPAYYAKVIPTKTFSDALSASGKLMCEGRHFNALIGFFNTNTMNEWRTANTIALRVYGRGDVFYCYAEYCTAKWRAGALDFGSVNPATGRRNEKQIPGGTNVHTWSLRYDPNAGNGAGAIIARFDGEEIVQQLEPGHRADGAAFNRFGFLNIVKSHDTGGELWLDDVTVLGERETFSADPRWDGLRNRTNYMSRGVRPWFDFGFSNTRYAGGNAGELGGVIFRGDGRDTNKLAFYGDRLESLGLDRPLKASGKVAMRRGVSDSDTLIGFFQAEHSMDSGGSDRFSIPPDFLGVRIGGPSREGFYFEPLYRLHSDDPRVAGRGPYIYPNGEAREWTLEYQPQSAEETGRITVTLGGETLSFNLRTRDKSLPAHFNRFGIITTHTDGNAQEVYFDDLTYTFRQ